MEVRRRTVHTANGRRLAVVEAGANEGPAILHCHGTPASSRLFVPWASDARERGVRLIAYDRPGYGGSSPHPDRSVADAPADIVAIADALGIGALAVWGISGGAPHALACAALVPGRVAAVAALAGPAPFGSPGLDWLAGMGDDNIEEFGAALEGRAVLTADLDARAEGVRTAETDSVIDEFRSLVGPVDAAVLTGELAQFLLATMQEGLVPGIDGWLDDDLAFVAPWGFDLAAVAAPVLLWHGVDDRFVPVAHGRWLAERIPGIDARISENDGHLSLMTTRIAVVHEWLASHL